MTRCVNCRPQGSETKLCEMCCSQEWKMATNKDIPPHIMMELERRGQKAPKGYWEYVGKVVSSTVKR